MTLAQLMLLDRASQPPAKAREPRVEPGSLLDIVALSKMRLVPDG